jgi:hypothetical protein
VKISKHIAILLSVLLLVSNVGLAFNVHYCGGKMASVSLVSQKSNADKDCCGKSEKKSSCCKDKKIKLEKKTDNSVLKTFSFQLEIPFTVYAWQPISALDFTHFESNQFTAFYCDSNAPPLYRLYSQYIFYA